MPSRDAIFISHGNPQDNEIAGWLAARLRAAGYKVWIDLWHGKGHPTWEEIEAEIRTSACRVIALVSRAGAIKPGFKDEINAASGVARELDDKGFILPIRLDDIAFRTEVPIQIGRLNFIDGHLRGWDEILAELFEQLEKDSIPRSTVSSNALFEIWLARRRAARDLITVNPEPILSNWFCLEALPKKINFYSSDSVHSAWESAALALKIPNRYQEGILCTFAAYDDVRMKFPLGIKVKKLTEIKTEMFLKGDDSSPLFKGQVDAKRVMVDLVRQGFTYLALQRGFEVHQLSNRICWYPKLSTVSDKQIPFNSNGFSGSRQLIGRHKEFYWHYAVSIDLAWTPPLRITASGHVVFSVDGEKIISNPKITAKLRRRALRSKRNAWWRDVMLTYFAKLAGDNGGLLLPTGGDAPIVVSTSPVAFTSPLRIEFDSDFAPQADGPIDESEEDNELDEEDLLEGEQTDGEEKA